MYLYLILDKYRKYFPNPAFNILLINLIYLFRFMQSPGYKMADIKRFFRVGVVLGKPWAWIENASNPLDRQFLDPSKKNLGLVGK